MSFPNCAHPNNIPVSLLLLSSSLYDKETFHHLVEFCEPL